MPFAMNSEQTAKVGEPSEPAASILQADNLKKSFAHPLGGKLEVLKGVSLQVAKGESVSVRGESGSGKSTFLSLLAGLDQPDSGTLFWDSQSFFSLSQKRQSRERARFLGMVFQAFYLIPELNALDNVLMARRILGLVRPEDRERAAALIERVGMADRRAHLPSQMSGGEAQRIAVARALLNSPPLILADEPTGNLDEKTGETVMELLLNICREEGTSLVLVTHNPAFAKRTHRSLFLREGTLH